MAGANYYTPFEENYPENPPAVTSPYDTSINVHGTPKDPGTQNTNGNGLQMDTPDGEFSGVPLNGSNSIDWGGLLKGGLQLAGSPLVGGLASGALGMWNDSTIKDMISKYVPQMDPFGAQRGYYQDRLKQMTEDPNAYLAKSPDYQAALKQGIGALDSSLSARGFSGSGHAADETQQYGSQLATQFLDRDRQSLMQMAGAQIGPGAAANMISHGYDAMIQNRNNALTSLFAGLKQQGGGDNGAISQIIKSLTGAGGLDPSSVVKTLQAAGFSMKEISNILGGHGGIDGGGTGEGNGPDPNAKVYNGPQPNDNLDPPFDPGYYDGGWDGGGSWNPDN